MSQYLNVYVESSSGEFIHWTDFSRNHDVYTALTEQGNFQWEKITLVTSQTFTNAINYLKDMIKYFEDRNRGWENAKKDIGLIATNEETAQAAIREIYDISDTIEKNNDRIKDLEYAIAQLMLLEDIDSPIYAGIEISNPTKDDVI